MSLPDDQQRPDEDRSGQESAEMVIRAPGEIGRGFTREEHAIIARARAVAIEQIKLVLQRKIDKENFVHRIEPHRFLIPDTDPEEIRKKRLEITDLMTMSRERIFERFAPRLTDREGKQLPIGSYGQFEHVVAKRLSRSITPFAVKKLRSIELREEIAVWAVEEFFRIIESEEYTGKSMEFALSLVEDGLKRRFDMIAGEQPPDDPVVSTYFPAPSLLHIAGRREENISAERTLTWEEVIKSTELTEDGFDEKRMHAQLPPKERELVNERIRVRLAGWENDERVDLKRDVQLLKDLERGFVQWLADLLRANNDKELEKDEHGLNEKQYEAIRHFHMKGGHMGGLSAEKIRTIIRRGIIVFLEADVGHDTYIPVGSVSALLPIPATPLDAKGYDKDFPNYDVKGIQLPENELQRFLLEAKRTMMVVRSTIRERLSTKELRQEKATRELLKRLPGNMLPEEWEGRKLRRLGLAARGKAEIFHTALSARFSSVSMNIGRLRTPQMTHINMGTNRPSHEHNSWIRELAWRNYENPIIKDTVTMYWLAYFGSLAEGIQAFEAPGGILEGKGYDLNSIQTSVDRTRDQLMRQGLNL